MVRILALHNSYFTLPVIGQPLSHFSKIQWFLCKENSQVKSTIGQTYAQQGANASLTYFFGKIWEILEWKSISHPPLNQELDITLSKQV